MDKAFKTERKSHTFSLAALTFSLGLHASLVQGYLPPVPSPASIPSDGPSSSSDKVGSLGGKFRVNEQGQANYDIPIVAPAGVAGVTPKLALKYNSQGGPGLLGAGWSISGISAISRCRQTRHQDGHAKPITWTSEDRFCLNGQRLIMTSSGNGVSYGDPGTTYALEVSDYSTITALGGQPGQGSPDYFTVEAKDGSTTRFGAAGNSEAEQRPVDVNGSPINDKVLSWSMSRYSDSAANYIYYVYQNGIEGHRLRHVFYAYPKVETGYRARIEFQYTDNRLDPVYGYTGGYKFGSNKLLNKVLVRNDDATNTSGYLTLREYRLAYHQPSNANGHGQPHNRLKSVTECRSTNCYKPTTFTWPTQSWGYQTNIPDTVFPQASGDYAEPQYADLNGDGYLDLVWLERSTSTFPTGQYDGHTWRYALYVPAFDANQQEIGNFGGTQNIHVDGNSYSIASPRMLDWALLDYNSDGRTDVLIPVIPAGGNDSTVGTWKVFLSNDNGVDFTNPIDLNAIDPAGGFQVAAGNKIKVVDLNSDALPDIVHDFGGSRVVRLMQRSPAAAQYANSFSGIIHQIEALLPPSYPAPGKPPGWTVEWLLAEDLDQALQLGDFNGDGNVDLVASKIIFPPPGCKIGQLNCFPESLGTHVLLSETGTLTTGGEPFLPEFVDKGFVVQNPMPDYGSMQQIADINGDGLADMLVRDKSFNYIHHVRLSTGTSFETNQVPGSILEFERANLMDVDQDGTLELIYPNSQGIINYQYFDTGADNFHATVQGFGSQFTLSMTGNGYTTFSFSDVNSDGLPDWLAHNSERVNFKKRTGATNRITKINNGLGTITDIEYASLADNDVYGVDSDSLANRLTWDLSPFEPNLGKPEHGIFDVRPNSTQVVKVVKGTMPAAGVSAGQVDEGAVSTIVYSYRNAKLEAGGGGLLGFGTVATIDPQTGIISTTDYRQDHPFTGLPRSTETLKITGYDPVNEVLISKLLRQESNFWAFQNSTGPVQAPYNIYAGLVLEKQLDLNTDTDTTTEIGLTVSVKQIDEWGNNTYSKVETFKKSTNFELLSRVETDNDFDPLVASNPWDQRLGRLRESVVTYHRPGTTPNTIVRKSKFEYGGSTGSLKGLLKKEILHPDDPQNRRTTTYWRDIYGNVRTKTVAGDPDGSGPLTNQVRTTKFEYDSHGRLENAIYVNTGNTAITAPDAGIPAGYLRVKKVIQRNQWGSPTQILDTYGNLTTIRYGALGREYLRHSGTGTWQKTQYVDTQLTPGSICPSPGTFVQVRVTTAEGQELDTCQDALGRTIRTSKLGFQPNQRVYQETEYNPSGLARRTSVPHFANAGSVYWSRSSYDYLLRPLAQTQPNGVTMEYEYTGLVTSIENLDNGQRKFEARNFQGELTAVVDANYAVVSYEYDAAGDLHETTTINSFFAPTQSISIVTQHDSYGRKISTNDPDSGSWTYKYNAFAELVEQIDGLGQRTVSIYDQMGRMTNRKEYWPSSPFNPKLAIESDWYYDKYQSQPQVRGALVASDTSSYSVSGSQDGQETVFFDYDSRGREVGKSTVLDFYLPAADQQIFEQVTTYDQYGRVFYYLDLAADERGTQNLYNARGYVSQVKEAYSVNSQTAQKVYSETLEVDAFGNRTRYKLGARTIERDYLADMGWETDIVGIGTGQFGTPLDQVSTSYDGIGNRIGRTRKENGAIISQQSYCYDDLNRLTNVYKNQATNSCSSSVHDFKYDAFGNITEKDGKSYLYQQTGNAGPHAVTKIGSDSFFYDGNGSLISDTLRDRALEYSTFNKVREVSNSNASVEFQYGIDRNRYRRVDTVFGAVKKTWYSGRSRLEQKTTGKEIKRHINNEIVVVHPLNTNGAVQTSTTSVKYQLLDHLGSVIANYAESVALAEIYMRYDAWGHRLEYNSGNPYTLPIFVSVLPLGFTGHEHIEQLGFIHMNGRIYDPEMGRFMQADPFIDGVTSTQGYNRYTYVGNNPLSYTDPSGYLTIRTHEAFNIATTVIVTLATWGVGTPAAAGANSTITIGQAAAAGAAGGFTTGFVASGDLGLAARSALFGAVSAAAFTGIGGYFTGETSGGLFHIASHGVVGGAMAELQGGEFGHGFISAGLTKALGPVIGRAEGWVVNQRSIQQVIVAGLVGGTISELSGGKFGNGALSAAMGNLFNAQRDAPKGNGVIGYDSDGVPIFDESHPRFHNYYDSNSCAKGSGGCTYANARAGLLRFPAPGASGKPIADEQIGFAIVGLVRHEVYDSGAQVINVTLEGKHLLAPGTVRRWVTEDVSSVTIHTYGEGTGRLPGPNVTFSESLWRGVDNSIFDYMRQQ